MAAFWDQCLTKLQADLSVQQFDTWIKPLIWDESESLRLLAPNQFFLEWVRSRFALRIQNWAEEHYGAARVVEFGIAQKAAMPVSNGSNGYDIEDEKKSVPTAPPIRERKAATASRLNPAYTFDSFVGGRANQLARAAAMQVAENPGVSYNPLFVYGGVGLGKTHLLHAIGNMVQTRNPEMRVRHLHANDYVGDVVAAYRQKTFDHFKREYQSLDVLLIDDIQFFYDKGRTQEEFFYAFNALSENHRQIVISSDTFPKDLKGFEDRLKSRFAWGLTVAIEPPELEMRVAILIRKAQEDGVDLGELDDSGVAFFIAKQVRASVRELEGALRRVLAYSRFIKKPISIELAKEALRDLIAATHRQVSIENIQKTVADYYKIKVAEMYSSKRTRNLARPRQIAMALAKELTNLSLPEIGEAFGGRDHTTVLHACRKVAELRNSDPEIGRSYLLLIQTLTS
jgi:chromosomal replication initiator protein